MTITRDACGSMPDGRPVTRWTIANGNGVGFAVIDYGCAITEVKVPDRAGTAANITLGFDSLAGYLDRPMSAGTVIGRFANRIRGGSFLLEGAEHRLACNNGANHLHGGRVGFERVLWRGRSFRRADTAGVSFAYTSRDGDEGYPGTLKVVVAYSLNEANDLRLEYRATTDRPTPVSLTNHAYWNLAASGTIHEHLFESPSEFYLPVTPDLIPTGEIRRVAGTPLDFTTAKPIGRDIGSIEGGYDHCFTVKRRQPGLDLACRVTDPTSGRRMEVWTTAPGFQFYSGNILDGRTGAGGRVFVKHAAFCIEPECFPDSMNVGHFPSCILRPGETYRHITVHRFPAP